MAGAAPSLKSYSLWVMPRGGIAAAAPPIKPLCKLPPAASAAAAASAASAASAATGPNWPPSHCPAQPAAPLSDKLHAEVRRLAAAVPDAPTFLPHVTLLGGVRATEADVLERARSLAGQLKVRAG